ncbi:MAG: type II secretion system protein N [Gammaproteobacteria bacterium]|nr:type II secretion system protein N [Gammaproteobacteria bacterium]
MKWVGIGLAIAITFCILFLILAPARFVVQRIDPNQQFLREATGTIWVGQVNTYHRTALLGHVAWQAKPASLLRGKIAYSLEYIGHGVSLEAETERGWSTLSVVLNGQIDPQAINLILSHYEMDITGSLEIQDLSISLTDDGVINLAEGEIHWAGGSVHYGLGSNVHQTRLPAMVGRFHKQNGGIQLTISEGERELMLMTAMYDPATGEIAISASNRLVVLADAPWLTKGEESDIAFTVYEKLFEPD